MSAEYIKYIPQILTNTKSNAILLTLIPGLLYTGAAYGAQYIKGASLMVSIIVSCIFAILEYIVRVPINFYSARNAGFSNTEMQIIWTIICLGFAKSTDLLLPAHLKK